MRLVGYIAMLVIASSCDDSGFRGGNDNRAPVKPLIANGSAAQNSGLRTEMHNGAQREPYKVDIFFLLDSSDSMDSKIKQTISRLQPLLSNFLDRASQYDYQVFMVGNVSVPTGPKVHHIPSRITSHSALSVAVGLMKGEAGGAGSLIRRDSVKELVVVSDDDASMSAANFITAINELNQVVRVNGIVTTGSTCGGFLGIGAGARGDVYIELSKNPQTQGVLGDICAGNWDPIFSNLGSHLTQLKTAPNVRITLGSPVTAPQSIQVHINGQPVPSTSFQFDPLSNSVVISHPTEVTDQIKVSYQ